MLQVLAGQRGDVKTCERATLRVPKVDAATDRADPEATGRAKVDAGLRELDEGKGIPHEDVEERLGAPEGGGG